MKAEEQSWVRRHAWDFICVFVLCLLALVGPYFLLGFDRYDFSYIPRIAGGDFITVLTKAKLIGETGWVWFNDSLGAPFGSSDLGFAASLLMNFENLVTLIIYQFFHDPIATITAQYLLFFPMTAFVSYCVMRSLGIRYGLSFAGSIVFAWLPYIFVRIGHFGLAACYFIPLSILLCIWAFSDKRFLKLNKHFFRYKRNILAIVFALLIANNGLGYYAFFTCFFLCVTALCLVLRSRSIKDIQGPVIAVCLIVFFFIVALSPSLIYGAESTAVRSPADAEMYSLKITQLFMPIDGHGIGWLEKIINTYNTSMPLVNENQWAYLGIVGGLGFLASIGWLFGAWSQGRFSREMYLLSRLNLAAVLFGIIGGFGAIFALTITNLLRGFNRVSVFIAFCSILFLCMLIERALRSQEVSGKRSATLVTWIAVALVFSLSAIEQIPSSFFSDEARVEFDSDAVFVHEIEELSGEEAMIWQMPYRVYPEAGLIHSMDSYDLERGYLHSKSLRWSFGAPQGSEGDIWNKKIAEKPFPEMIDFLKDHEYAGIYIDSRAYTAEGFSLVVNDIAVLVGHQPIFSPDGMLAYFDFGKAA